MWRYDLLRLLFSIVYLIESYGRTWLAIVGSLTLLGLVVGWVVETLRLGNPVKAVGTTLRGLFSGAFDLLMLPFGIRRIWAIAKLCFMESIRRRILYVFILFLAPFLFAGWYLPNSYEGQLVSNVALIDTAMTFLLLPLVLFLVSMSLPNDIKLRTVQTVVTKPVRRSEIVVGRILGFMGIFSFVILLMGAISLIYLRAQVYGSQPQGLIEDASNGNPIVITSKDHGLQTGAIVQVSDVGGNEAANVTARIERVDSRKFRLEGVDGSKAGKFTTGGAWRGLPSNWTSRVTVEASARAADAMGMRAQLKEQFVAAPLTFFKKGQMSVSGTNIGKESTYRSHVEGETNESAHWYFGFDPAQFENREQVPVELRFDIFKTTKGNPTRDDAPESGVWCLLTVFRHHPEEQSMDRRRVEVFNTTYKVDKDRRHVIRIPSDATKSGLCEITAQCLSRNQFLGMGVNDCYLLADEKPFELNFVKGLFSIWLKVFLLTSVAVSMSTVLNGFVTVLVTTTVYVLGFFHQFVIGVVSGSIAGGGPVESLIRLVTQDAATSTLDETFFNGLAKKADYYLLKILALVARVIPDLTSLDTKRLVANGFDVAPAIIGANFLIVVSYVIPVAVIGYFAFKNREIAA